MTGVPDAEGRRPGIAERPWSWSRPCLSGIVWITRSEVMHRGHLSSRDAVDLRALTIYTRRDGGLQTPIGTANRIIAYRWITRVHTSRSAAGSVDISCVNCGLAGRMSLCRRSSPHLQAARGGNATIRSPALHADSLQTMATSVGDFRHARLGLVIWSETGRLLPPFPLEPLRGAAGATDLKC